MVDHIQKITVRDRTYEVVSTVKSGPFQIPVLNYGVPPRDGFLNCFGQLVHVRVDLESGETLSGWADTWDCVDTARHPQAVKDAERIATHLVIQHLAGAAHQ